MALDSPPTPRHTARPALDVLVTRNLTLRPPLQVDCDSIAEALADPTVSRNLTGVPHPYGVKDAQAWLESFATTYPDDVVYTVHRERLIGVVAVHIRDGKPALGYWFSPCAWGKGYATQACRAVLAQAFRILGAEHIDAAAYTDNAGSLRVLEKLGFEQTGMGVHTNPTRGEDADAVDMRLTRERFEARFGALETEQAA